MLHGIECLCQGIAIVHYASCYDIDLRLSSWLVLDLEDKRELAIREVL